MFYTYVLLSLKDKQFYSGYTADLNARLKEHQRGRVESTKSRRPLKLVYYEACLNQRDALGRERYFKTYYGKMFFKKRVKHWLEK